MTIKIDSSIDKIKEWISEKEVLEILLAFDLIETDIEREKECDNAK